MRFYGWPAKNQQTQQSLIVKVLLRRGNDEVAGYTVRLPPANYKGEFKPINLEVGPLDGLGQLVSLKPPLPST